MKQYVSAVMTDVKTKNTNQISHSYSFRFMTEGLDPIAFLYLPVTAPEGI